MQQGARLIVAALALAVAGAAVVLGPALVGADASTSRGVLWLTGFTQLLWLALAVVLAALAQAAPIGDRLGLRASRLDVRSTAIAIVGMLLLSHGLNAILLELQVREGSSIEAIDQLVRESREAAPWLAVIAIALLPGIAEELLFRGASLELLRARFGPVVGVCGSALLFGLAHLDPVHVVAAFVLGLYLGVVAVCGHSVWPAVACHVANNAVGVISQWIAPGPAPGSPWLLVPAALCLAAVWAQSLRERNPASSRNGR